MSETSSTPAISVVLCTYNGEQFIEEQLRSILAQTLLPREIIISDDGSRDRTLEIARDVIQASRHDDIEWTILERKKPLGPAQNFGGAMKKARHEIIALADQDDVWEPAKLEILSGHFSADPRVLLVHSDATIINDQGIATGSLMNTLRVTSAELGLLASGQALRALVKRNLVTGATVVLSKSLLEAALPIPDGWVHDEWMALVAGGQGAVSYEPLRLVRYRQHSGNQIGANKTDIPEARRRLGESWSGFHAKKALRDQGITALLASSPAWLSTDYSAVLEGKVGHDQWRARLPLPRARRFFPVWSRFITGHYSRYARGLIDVARDLSLTDG